MNELLAIVIIVIICCAIFFTWLMSMAICPDKMINWLSGGTGNSTCSTSYESKELIARDENDEKASVKTNDVQNSSTYLQMSNIARRSNSKKLSVVPEQDEQLTVTSISQILFPTPNRQNNYVNTNGNMVDGAQRLAAHFEANDVPEAVVVVGNSANIAFNDQPCYGDNSDYHGAQQPLRFHYSMPILST